MQITWEETTTQVLVKAYTTLQVDDLKMQVKQRAARIKRAKVYWIYHNGEWQLDFIHVWGPVIRKSDGAESSQHISENTKPAASARSYDLTTPAQLVKVALANTPKWTPVINETSYPREPSLKTSL